ncbi:MAG: GNAT family N-acetyltransferase [Dehalococcoidales bacterium]|jgi:ribosomal-protein-serine acetyltransferase|nr:GNAT family N-acetyltransferase [Dehalococcoidales bacterium]
MRIEKDIVLSNGKVLLRCCRIDDAQEHCNAVHESIEELARWMSWASENYSVEDSLIWLKACNTVWDKGMEYNFTIVDAETQGIMGWCGLNRIDYQNMTASLGYWVRKQYYKQGVASTAAMLLAGFGFEKLQFKRIEIKVAKGNIASQRVAEKIGAVREGVLRNMLFERGKTIDGVMFSLIPDDIMRKENGTLSRP